MSDRPIAAVLAVLAAVMFVAAFSAAAVLRPDSAPVTPEANARVAPASATERARTVALDTPSLSAVAPLPALHLPKPKPKPKRKPKPKPKPAAKAPAPAPAAPAPTAVPRRVTPPPSTPRYTPPPAKPKSPAGTTFDSKG
jgi:outer membrane biosynthesis protein TonB